MFSHDTCLLYEINSAGLNEIAAIHFTQCFAHFAIIQSLTQTHYKSFSMVTNKLLILQLQMVIRRLIETDRL